MIKLNSLIIESFDAISVILVFVFVLFNLYYPKINEAIKKEIPSKVREHERKIHKKILMEELILRNSPLVIINGVLVYLFLPTIVRIFMESIISLWDFNFLKTTFVFIFLFIVCFFLWSSALFIKLASRIYQTSKG